MRTVGTFPHARDAQAVAARTTIFKAGSPPDCMYYVAEGQVDILIDGKPVETVSAGGIFGEMALIENANRTATAVAKTDAKIVAIDQRQFLTLIKETPSFALQVMRVLSDRLRRMDARPRGETTP